MPQDYYSSLANLVRSCASDDAQKRRAIYALARSELRQFLARQQLNGSARKQELRALEAAIHRIECEFAQPRERDLTGVVPAIEILPPGDHLPNFTKLHPEPRSHPRLSTTHFLLSLAGAALLVIITYLVVERGLHDGAPSTISASPHSVDADQPLAQASRTEFAIPSTYGVYALSDGHLIELSPLSIKIPNRLIPISVAIDSTSAAKLPNGRTQFVVFRRDMANNAPEKVYVRRIVQIAQPSRQPGVGPDENVSWTISDISYEMRVGPINGNPAMILIRPPASNFAFPAGRYALVIRSTAYDFSVEAGVTDGAQ